MGLLILSPQLVSAERLPVKTYTATDGLANNVINRIVSDSYGFLWFCTREGLTRFDGYEFTSFGLDDGLPSATVNDLLEARDGRYWVATSRGLVWFRPFDAGRGVEIRFHPVTTGSHGSAVHVSALLQDHSGAIWIGTADGLRMLEADRLDRAPLLEIEPRGVEVTCLRADAQSALWIGTGVGLYRRTRDGRVQHFTTRDGLPEDFVQSILPDGDQSIWVGTRLAGLAKLVETDGRLRVVEAHRWSAGFASDWIADILRASDGRLWVGTPGGLVACAAGPNGQCRAHTIAQANGLPRGGVLALAEDDRHQLWVGSPTGVARILPADITIYDESDGTPTAATLLESPAGDLVVMDAGGYVRFSRRTPGGFVGASLPLALAAASWGWNQLALVDRRGDWWVGTRNGLLRFQGLRRAEQIGHALPTARYTRREGLASDIIIRLFEDSHGDIWVGTVGEGERNGLARWNPTAQTFEPVHEQGGLPSFDRYYVSAFAEDRRGRVWIGFSGDGGLVRYDSGRFTHFAAADGIPSGSLRNLIIDRKGRLWAASYQGGLLRCDDPTAERPTFTRHTTATGLASNEVTAIGEDRLGRIYAATARGIDRVDLDTGRVDHFRAGIGLPLGEIHSSLLDRTGALWFASNSGLIRFVPTAPLESKRPAVLIMAISIAGRIAPAYNNIGSSATLPHGSGPLQIDYVSPGIHTDDGLRYQIRLQGAADGWGDPTAQRSVVYANLAPGEYTFGVRAIAPDGTESTPATFAFHVLPPLWQRWWVLSSVISALSAAAWILHRRQIARVTEIANMRTRIATDLHDDIGANLTRIAVLSEVVRARHEAGAPLDDRLGSIAAVARESIAAMADIVWAISPERDTLSDLRRKMIEYGEDVLSTTECRLVVAGGDVEEQARIGVDARRDVYLIFKEALNNAARHARCSEIRLTISTEASRLRLAIVDDGGGFERTSANDGHGLVSMQRRAARLGGVLEIRSVVGRGTSILLDVPLPRR